MTKYNPKNERIKRQYLAFLKEAKRQSETSLDAVAKALSRFESYTGHRDFKGFHIQQAVGFKNHLAEQVSKASGRQLSKSTVHSTLSHLKRFFQWLAGQPGYKSRISYSDAEYFNISAKDSRIATAKREQRAPSVDQIKKVIHTMAAGTAIERRNRALIAFILLTGIRHSAAISLKLKHINVEAKCVYQDAREVRTKYSKSFPTYFFPVGDEIIQIVAEWVRYLGTEHLWADDDPLFPATKVALGPSGHFEATGLTREHWRSAAPMRAVFQDAFEGAGLPYYNPHSFRNTLVGLGETLCKTPEDFKAWSQNLGHEGVLTTFYSYGEVPDRRQASILTSMSGDSGSGANTVDEIAEAVARKLRGGPTDSRLKRGDDPRD